VHMRIIFHCFASLTLEYDTQAEGLPTGVALTTTSTIFDHCIVVLLVVEYSLFASLVLAVVLEHFNASSSWQPQFRRKT